jgi:DsbC/DsbD-like thiol-disulfide interchange protein
LAQNGFQEEFFCPEVLAECRKARYPAGPSGARFGDCEVVMRDKWRTASVLWVVAALTSVIPAGAAEDGAVTPWVEAQAARVRLLAGADRAPAGKSLLAGVEITMAEGWKTYWRNPGEAGIPPNFDWSGSTNTASIKVAYPAPMRVSDPAAEMIGYKTSVVFPVTIVPRAPAEPVDVRLALEFAVCREICIPAQASLELRLPPLARLGAPAAALAAAQARVPRPQASRHASDPQLLEVRSRLTGPAPNLEIDAKFPGGAAGADLFLEAPDGIFVPMAKKLAVESDGRVRFVVDLARGGSAEDLKGKELTLTLVSEAGASEANVRLE